MSFPFTNLALARLLEEAEALAGVEGAEAAGAPVLHIAGAHAVCMGDGSPMTQVLGLGLHGPVSEADLDTVENFFRSHGAAVCLHANPLADPSLFEALGKRCYRAVEFNNVLVRTLAPGLEPPARLPAPGVRIAAPGERDLWAQLLARSFFEHAPVTGEELAIGINLFQKRGSLCYLASLDGLPAGAAAMSFHNDLAILYGDGTPPEFRGRGVQYALIRARLEEAAVARGCTLATASTLPGSASQRNYERAGFRAAYTKSVMRKE